MRILVDLGGKMPKKKESIPSLICTNKPTKGKNDGLYEVSIPLKYIIKACEAPAAYFVFKFIGLKNENNN